MPDTQTIVFNGINGETGEYLLAPMELNDVVALLSGEPPDKRKQRWLAKIWNKLKSPFLGLPVGVDPADISRSGWGIVFLKDEDPAVRAALAPLVEHRRKQIGNDAVVKELEVQPGVSVQEWLAGYGVAAGSVKPTRVPFYLLLIGDPQKLSFEFGQILDVEYAVGRLHFDTPGEYAQYVASLIEYETAASVPNAREAAFFGTRHSFDQATRLSADCLVNPLTDGTPATATEPALPGVAEQWGFATRKLWGPAATKTALNELICQPGGAPPPALLFTASHGMGFTRGHPQQRSAQGALLCQEWPGFGSIAPNHYFAASDVPPDGRVQGMVIFHFACYGGGTPELDRFVHEARRVPTRLADQAFIAELPKRWLTHPRGSALACIGHVERAWGYSITPPDAGVQIQTFQNALGRILTGQPLGLALKDFNDRYAELSTYLAATLEKKGWGGGKVDENALATNWIERNDAEGYILIGDPAVRLRTADLMVP